MRQVCILYIVLIVKFAKATNPVHERNDDWLFVKQVLIRLCEEVEPGSINKFTLCSCILLWSLAYFKGQKRKRWCSPLQGQTTYILDVEGIHTCSL